MHDPKQSIPEKEPLSYLVPARLPPVDCLGLVKVSGPDAKKLLQGQLTCNLDEITAAQSRLGAHCNPQGRILCLFRLFSFLDAYYLVLPRSMVAPALQGLKKYAIFFNLSLMEATEESNTALQALAAQEWAYFDLAQAIPQVYPETRGCFLPHELNLPALQGISWNKGCYTGQEIIARMQYRGKSKNQLRRAVIQTLALPYAGATVYSTHPKGTPTTGLIVDYRQLGYNLYILLVRTNKADEAASFKLDLQQNETWEWLE